MDERHIRAILHRFVVRDHPWRRLEPGVGGTLDEPDLLRVQIEATRLVAGVPLFIPADEEKTAVGIRLALGKLTRGKTAERDDELIVIEPSLQHAPDAQAHLAIRPARRRPDGSRLDPGDQDKLGAGEEFVHGNARGRNTGFGGGADTEGTGYHEKEDKLAACAA